METLDNTDWDVKISGTGLQQSLLALALSRSGKSILHVDENPYYSDTSVSVNLQEAEEWIDKVNKGAFGAAFAKASIHKPVSSDSDSPSLSRECGRRYNLALAPEVLYAKSAFRHYIVAARIHTNLNFLPVGAWWMYASDGPSGNATGELKKVPQSREDLFANKELSFEEKRKLVKIMRFLSAYESDDNKAQWENYRNVPVSAFFSAVFKCPAKLLAPLLSFTLLTQSPDNITTQDALPKIVRHFRSSGDLGNFSALCPMYGGLDEMCQVACRACAVGGGIYMLGNGLSTSDGSISVVQKPAEDKPSNGSGVLEEGSQGEEQPTDNDVASSHKESTSADPEPATQVNDQRHVSRLKLHLKEGEAVTTRWLVGETSSEQVGEPLCKSITIVSSSLDSLFPKIVAGASQEEFQSAAAIVFFPTGSLSLSEQFQSQNIPPVYINAHSSRCGECPSGQSVLYASTSPVGDRGFELLNQAITRFLSSVDDSPSPTILWSMQFEQRAAPSTKPLPLPEGADDHVFNFSPVPLDLAIDDAVLDRVREAWQTITDEDPGTFLVFSKREGEQDEEVSYDME